MQDVVKARSPAVASSSGMPKRCARVGSADDTGAGCVPSLWCTTAAVGDRYVQGLDNCGGMDQGVAVFSFGHEWRVLRCSIDK